MKDIRLRLSEEAHTVIKREADYNLRSFQGQSQWVLEAYAAGELVERKSSVRRPSKPVFKSPHIAADGTETVE